MTESIYRDALLGLRARVAELDSRIAEREAQVSIDLVHFLPHDLQERIGALRASRTAPGDTMEELSLAEERGASYLQALDRALALVPDLERELRALPQQAPPLARTRRGAMRWGMGAQMSEALTTVGAVLARIVARHDSSASVEPLEDFAFHAQLVAVGSPIALLVECFVDRERPFEPHVQVGTSVARGASRVVVAPESWGQSLVRSLGITSAITTRDLDFDGRFVVEGDAAQAMRILSPPVRASLIAIARDDVPKLVVEDGRAVLSWSFEPTDRAMDAAFFVLGRIRAADVALRLVR